MREQVGSKLGRLLPIVLYFTSFISGFSSRFSWSGLMYILADFITAWRYSTEYPSWGTSISTNSLPPLSEARNSSYPPPLASFGNSRSKSSWSSGEVPYANTDIFFSPKPASFSDVLSLASGMHLWSTLDKHTKVCVHVFNFFFFFDDPRELAGRFPNPFFLPVLEAEFQANSRDNSELTLTLSPEAGLLHVLRGEIQTLYILLEYVV